MAPGLYCFFRTLVVFYGVFRVIYAPVRGITEDANLPRKCALVQKLKPRPEFNFLILLLRRESNPDPLARKARALTIRPWGRSYTGRLTKAHFAYLWPLRDTNMQPRLNSNWNEELLQYYEDHNLGNPGPND